MSAAEEMHAAAIELEVRLETAIELLEHAGERYWVITLGRALTRMRSGELTGVSQVMSAFQGEGTLSDLELGDADDPSLQRRWLALRETLFQSADRLLVLIANERRRR